MKRAAIPITGESKKGPPRNRRLFDQGQLARAEIRALLEKHPPLAPPLTWKHIRPYLTNKIKKRAIEGHMKAVRDEYAALSAIQTAQPQVHSAAHGRTSKHDSETSLLDQ